MKITREIAQKIADKASSIIGYNVNIMNKDAIIIGSNDETRIDCFHEGALQVIKTAETVEINEEEAVRMNSLKPGVRFSNGINLPIRFNNEIIGVVGIKGVPDEVRKYGQILRMIVETMIQQFFLEELVKLESSNRNKYASDLLSFKEGSNESDIIQRGKALGYDMLLPRIIVLFDVSNILEIHPGSENEMSLQVKNETIRNELLVKIKSILKLSEQDILVCLNNNKIVLFMSIGADIEINRQKEEILKAAKLIIAYAQEQYNKYIYIGIGTYYDGIEGFKKSYTEAEDAITIGKQLKKRTNAFYYGDLIIEHMLSYVPIPERERFISRINLDETLIETLKALLDNGLNVLKTAESMNIHRNTVTYRIRRIKELTNLHVLSMDCAFYFKIYLLLKELEKKIEAE